MLLLISQNVFSQYSMPDAPETFMEGLRTALDEVSIQEKIYQMRQNGISKASFSIAVGLNGHLVDIEDLDGYSDLEIFRVLPFEIIIAGGGRTYIKVAPLKLIGAFDEDDDGYWSAQALVFEYKENFDYENSTDYYLHIFKGEIERNLIGSEDSKFKMHAKLGGGIGTPLKLKIDGTNLYNEKDDADFIAGTGAEVTYGLNAHQSIGNSRIDLGISGGNSFRGYQNYWAPGLKERRDQYPNEYDNAVAEINNNYQQWADMTHQSYSQKIEENLNLIQKNWNIQPFSLKIELQVL